MGRWLTPVIIFGSFLYIPALLSGGMIDFYLKVVSSFVVPLLVVYLLGSFTRAHRSSALVGLVTGVGFGLYAFTAKSFAGTTALLPPALMDGNATGPVTFLATALAMMITTVIRGRETSPLFWQSPDALGQAEDTGTLPLALGLAVLALGLFLGFVIFI